MSIWRPHTTGILIGGVVVILVAVVVSFMATHFESKTDVRLGSGLFSVQVARTKAAREKGLSGVDQIGPNEGLLMVFDTDDTYGIWMKDMNFPIDIIWLDANKEVVSMVTSADPALSTSKTFTPTAPARYVLEVESGMIQNSAIKIGSVATFNLEGK